MDSNHVFGSRSSTFANGKRLCRHCPADGRHKKPSDMLTFIQSEAAGPRRRLLLLQAPPQAGFNFFEFYPVAANLYLMSSRPANSNRTALADSGLVARAITEESRFGGCVDELLSCDIQACSDIPIGVRRRDAEFSRHPCGTGRRSWSRM